MRTKPEKTFRLITFLLLLLFSSVYAKTAAGKKTAEK